MTTTVGGRRSLGPRAKQVETEVQDGQTTCPGPRSLCVVEPVQPGPGVHGCSATDLGPVLSVHQQGVIVTA